MYRLVVVLLFVAAPYFAQAQTTSGHVITTEEFDSNLSEFHAKNPLKTHTIHAGALPVAALQDLLNQKGVDGLRYYFALDEKLKLHLVFVGAQGLDDNYAKIVSPLGSNAAQSLTFAQGNAMVKRFVTSSLFGAYGSIYGGTMPKSEVLNMIAKVNGMNAVKFYFGRNVTTQKANAIYTPLSATGTELGDVMLLDRIENCPPDCRVPPPITQ